MRFALLAAVAVATSAVSQDDPFKSGVDLIAQVEQKCADGCIVFNREEAANLEANLNAIFNRQMREAFEAGKRDAQERCASLVSL